MLPSLIEKLEDVDDSARQHYSQIAAESDGNNGMFFLEATPVKGFSLENVEGLKSTVGATRTEVTEAKNALKPLQTQLKKAQSELSNLQAIDPEAEADKLAETKAAAKVAALQDEHLKVVEPLQSRISGLEGSIEQLVIVNGATAAITAAKGSLPLLLPFVQSHTRIRWEENKPVAEIFDDQNNPRIPDAKGTAMDFSGLVADLKERPEFAGAFEGTRASGRGTPPTGPGTKPMVTGGDMTSQDKIRAGLESRGRGV